MDKRGEARADILRAGDVQFFANLCGRLLWMAPKTSTNYSPL